jgi:hypothetical protein
MLQCRNALRHEGNRDRLNRGRLLVSNRGPHPKATRDRHRMRNHDLHLTPNRVPPHTRNHIRHRRGIREAGSIITRISQS